MCTSMACGEDFLLTSPGEHLVPRSAECEVALKFLFCRCCSWQQANLPLKLTPACFIFLSFLLHNILHLSTSVVHLNFLLPRSVRSLGLNLYTALFLTFLPFLLWFYFFFFFQAKQKIAFQGEKLPSPHAFSLSLPQTEEWTGWVNGRINLMEALGEKEVPWCFIT